MLWIGKTYVYVVSGEEPRNLKFMTQATRPDWHDSIVWRHTHILVMMPPTCHFDRRHQVCTNLGQHCVFYRIHRPMQACISLHACNTFQVHPSTPDISTKERIAEPTTQKETNPQGLVQNDRKNCPSALPSFALQSEQSILAWSIGGQAHTHRQEDPDRATATTCTRLIDLHWNVAGKQAFLQRHVDTPCHRLMHWKNDSREKEHVDWRGSSICMLIVDVL